MPKYTFCCNSCNFITDEYMTISDFLKKKKERKECSECNGGVLFNKVGAIRNRVDKDAAELIEDMKEDIQKTVKKIKSGDQRTIDNIYGDTPNPYKNRR